MNLLSAFGGGLWIIPVGFAAAAIYSAYRANKAIHSGSTRQLPGGGIEQSNKNVGWFQTAAGWFSVIFGLAAIGSSIWMYLEK